MTRATTLLDERSSPTLRARIGQLLAVADDAAFAVARIRLGVLDLTDQELARVRRCRVLLGHLDASTLLEASDPAGSRPTLALEPLRRFAAGGRLEVRSAGLAAWTPDFAVVRAGGRLAGLVGAIYFGSPDLVIGPAFTIPVTSEVDTALLGRRFDELWERSHDVLPAIREVLERAYELGHPAGQDRRELDPGPAVR